MGFGATRLRFGASRVWGLGLGIYLIYFKRWQRDSGKQTRFRRILPRCSLTRKTWALSGSSSASSNRRKHGQNKPTCAAIPAHALNKHAQHHHNRCRSLSQPCRKHSRRRYHYMICWPASFWSSSSSWLAIQFKGQVNMSPLSDYSPI